MALRGHLRGHLHGVSACGTSNRVGRFSCEDGDEVFDFSVEGNNIDEFADIQWDFGVGSPTLSNLESPSNINYGDASSWEATVYIENHGCTEEATFNYDSPADPVAVVEDQYQFCTGLTFDFVNLSENAEVYIWDFGDGQGGLPAGTSTDPNPTYTFPDTGVYTITLREGADFSCPDYATAEVEIQFLLEPEFVAPTPDCFEDHYFSMEGVASVDENTVYEWDFGGEVAFADVNDEVVNGLIYAEPGTYEVSLTASVPGLTGCLETFSVSVTAIAEPTIQFEAGPTSGCPPHSVSFTNLSTTETPTTYTWHFGDGNTSNAPNTSHQYTSAARSRSPWNGNRRFCHAVWNWWRRVIEVCPSRKRPSTSPPTKWTF